MEAACVVGGVALAIGGDEKDGEGVRKHARLEPLQVHGGRVDLLRAGLFGQHLCKLLCRAGLTPKEYIHDGPRRLCFRFTACPVAARLAGTPGRRARADQVPCPSGHGCSVGIHPKRTRAGRQRQRCTSPQGTAPGRHRAHALKRAGFLLQRALGPRVSVFFFIGSKKIVKGLTSSFAEQAGVAGACGRRRGCC